MLGASCSTELYELVFTKHKKPEETEGGMASDSKDTSSSGVLTGFVRID